MPRLALGEPPVIQSTGYSPTGYANREKSSSAGHWHFHLYLYDGELQSHREWIPFRPGWASLVPPGRDHVVKRGDRSPHWWVRFKTPGTGAPHRLLPEVWDLGGRVHWVTERLSRINRVFTDEPQLARARFWELLLELTREPEKSAEEESGTDRLADALRYLEKELDTRKPVAFLAERLGVTEGHVIRLFRKRFQTTPAAWRRKRLAERARLLLQESHLSPKQVADELGIRDLQHFNKLLRRELGVSPRAIRES